MYYLSDPEAFGLASPAHIEEVNRIVNATYGGAVPGQARLPGITEEIPYTDIELSGPGTVAFDRSLRLKDIEQAAIYWPGGSQHAPSVGMACYSTAEGTTPQDRMARGESLRSFILDATISSAALERRRQRLLEAFGVPEPGPLEMADIIDGVEQLCKQQRLPLGFVTITRIASERSERYASLSCPAGYGIHPRPILARMKKLIRTEASKLN